MAIDLPSVRSALAQLLPEKADEHASALVEDMDMIGLPIVVSPPSHGQLSLPFAGWCYHVKGTQFGPEKLTEKPRDITHHGAGFGLDLGNVHQLARVCQIGRALWGHGWSRRFKKDLCNGDKHLTTIEAIWWLGLWRLISHAKGDQKPFVGDNPKDVDWQFHCGADATGEHRVTTVNLEVKLRQRDWMRLVDGIDYSSFTWQDNFQEIEGKFSGKNPGQLNVAGVTLFGLIDREVQRAADEFCKLHPTLDAVILWTPSSTPDYESNYIATMQPEVRSKLRLFFHGGDEVDRAYRQPYVVFPWYEREIRQARRLFGRDFDPASHPEKIDGYSTHFHKILPVHL